MIRRRLPIRRRPLPPKFTPQWKGVFENYTHKWVHKHYWRVRHIVDSKEDAVQECSVVFAKCLDRYVRHGRVNNPAWFMALYSRSLYNTWNTMARRDEEARDAAIIHAMPDEQLIQSMDVDHNVGPLVVMWRDLSVEARIVLETMMNAPMELVDFVFSTSRPAIQNKRLLRLSRLPASHTNVIGEIAELLGNSTPGHHLRS